MAKIKTVQEAASNTPNKPPRKKRLNWEQERFVEEFVRHGNASLAYRNSHPGCAPETAKTNGNRALTRTHILEAIDSRRAADRELLNIKREDVLKTLAGMAFASLDDFAPLFSDASNRSNYRGLDYKRHALESAKKTVVTMEDGSTKETNEIKIISPGERRNALNELWDKLGLGEASGKENWFDGLERIADLIRGPEKKE